MLKLSTFNLLEDLMNLKLLLVTIFLCSSLGLADTSDQIRGQKSGYIAISPLLFTVETIGYGGIKAGCFFSEAITLELHRDQTTSLGGRYDIQQTFMSLMYYTGNSFFLRLGVGNRKIQHDLRYENEVYYHEYEGPDVVLKTNVVGGVFGLGNRWQLGRLTIGGDWFSLFIPSQIINKRRAIYGTNLENLEELEEKSLNRQRSIGTIIFPQFIIGMAF